MYDVLAYFAASAFAGLVLARFAPGSSTIALLLAAIPITALIPGLTPMLAAAPAAFVYSIRLLESGRRGIPVIAAVVVSGLEMVFVVIGIISLFLRFLAHAAEDGW